MPGDAEIPIPMRQWVGVNLEDDPTSLPQNQLQLSQNFYPAPTYSLRKRPGTAPYVTFPSQAGHPPLKTTSMVRAIDPAGNLYLYAYVQYADNDRIMVSFNGGVPTMVINGFFASSGRVGAVILMNQTIYAGNGQDPMVKIPINSSATQLTPPALGNDTGQSAVLVADTQSLLLTGTYSYRWAVYDPAAQAWVAIAPVETVIVTGRNDVTFTSPQAGAPATVLAGSQKWHLFVAFANQPIEQAFDQTASGLAAAATYTMATVRAAGTLVPIPSTLSPSGSMLVSRLGRLWFAGDTNNPRAVRATNVLLQGQEQALFAQADFFPANAIDIVDDTITGIGTASLSSDGQTPTAPFVITTKTKTWMQTGDITGDPTSTFIQISSKVGCVAYGTMVNTPLGLMMLGATSVYLVVPSTTEPIDIGWPIETAIRALTPSQQPGCVAGYEQGFYKLRMPSPGGTTNQQEWWLDLRPRIRQTVLTFPSWWGPMLTGAPLTAVASSPFEAGGSDVAFGAVAGGGTVVLLHQQGSFLDNGNTYQSRVVFPRHTWGDSFLRKRIKRVRSVIQTGAPILMPTTIRVDQNQAVTSALQVNQVPGAVWDVGIWDVGVWGSDIFQEADTQLGPTPISTEVQGQSMEVQIDHNVAQDVIIRDVEIRAQIISRKVG